MLPRRQSSSVENNKRQGRIACALTHHLSWLFPKHIVSNVGVPGGGWNGGHAAVSRLEVDDADSFSTRAPSTSVVTTVTTTKARTTTKAMARGRGSE